MYDWVEAVGLISPAYQVFDGTDDTINCTQLNHIQWTYNSGIFMYGAAVMWNQTTGAEQDKWRTRVQGLINGAKVFFYNNTEIMYEVACEPQMNCNTDQLSFKAYLARWMAATTKVAPWTYDQIKPYLAASATGAADTCTGGSDGVTCGTQWYIGHWDGTYGVGQQMSALEVMQSNLIDKVQGPVGNKTGGISVGDPSAGTGGDTNPGAPTGRITTGDKAGAGILTALVIVGILGGAWYALLSGLESCICSLLTFSTGGWWLDHGHETVQYECNVKAFGSSMSTGGPTWARLGCKPKRDKRRASRAVSGGVFFSRFFKFHLEFHHPSLQRSCMSAIITS